MTLFLAHIGCKEMEDRINLPKRLLVLDIGNTSVTGGLYHRGRVTHVHRIAETRKRTMAASDTLVELSNRHELIDCVISSVVPELVKPWSRMAKSWTGRQAILVTHKTPMPVGITFPRAETIGADRLANACGAYSRYGAPCIVIDIGTALTFDIVKPDEGYVGGVIGPGLPLMFDYMAEKTALLPHITPMKLKRSVGKKHRGGHANWRSTRISRHGSGNFERGQARDGRAADKCGRNRGLRKVGNSGARRQHPNGR